MLKIYHFDSEPNHTADVPRDRVWKRLHSTRDGSSTSLVVHTVSPLSLSPLLRCLYTRINQGWVRISSSQMQKPVLLCPILFVSSTGTTLHPQHHLSIHNLYSPVPRCPAKLFNFPNTLSMRPSPLSLERRDMTRVREKEQGQILIR